MNKICSFQGFCLFERLIIFCYLPYENEKKLENYCTIFFGPKMKIDQDWELKVRSCTLQI